MMMHVSAAGTCRCLAVRAVLAAWLAAHAAAGAADRDGAYDEVGKMVRSAVQHAAPPRAASPGGGGSRGRGGNGGGGFVAGLDLSIPVTLRSADELRTPFTNHVRGYQGLLDYIW